MNNSNAEPAQPGAPSPAQWLMMQAADQGAIRVYYDERGAGAFAILRPRLRIDVLERAIDAGWLAVSRTRIRNTGVANYPTVAMVQLTADGAEHMEPGSSRPRADAVRDAFTFILRWADPIALRFAVLRIVEDQHVPLSAVRDTIARSEAPADGERVDALDIKQQVIALLVDDLIPDAELRRIVASVADQPDGDAQWPRVVDLDPFGGVVAVVNHARALTRRAWQLWDHYGAGIDGFDLRFYDYSGSVLLDAIAAWHAKYQDRFEPRTERDPVLAGPLDVLDPEPTLLPGHHCHPRLIDLAFALDAAQPYVALALLEDAVPAELASGDEHEARRALAAVIDAYRRDERIVSDADAQHVLRTLSAEEPDEPLEISPRWRWAVRVVEKGGTIGGAGDGLPLHCFEQLEDAKRYAIQQENFSRHTAMQDLDETFHSTVVRAVERYDGVGTLIVSQPEPTWDTIIVPRANSPLSRSLPPC